VVLEIARAFGDTLAPRPVQSPVAGRELAEQELPQPPPRVDPVGPAEEAPALRQRSEREPVPGGDRLVVAQLLRPPLADREQPEPRLLVELAAQHEPAVLKGLEELVGRALTGRPGERR